MHRHQCRHRALSQVRPSLSHPVRHHGPVIPAEVGHYPTASLLQEDDDYLLEESGGRIPLDQLI